MIELTKETFAAEVLEAEGTILVDFYGDGCVPCQALMPHVHAMEDTYGKDIKFTALNTIKHAAWLSARRFSDFRLSLFIRVVRRSLSA